MKKLLSVLLPLGALAAVTALRCAAEPASKPRPDWQPGTSPLISITDCVRVLRDEQTGVASVARGLEKEVLDAPGARIRFRTNSPAVNVHLRYPARQVRNSTGLILIDGKSAPEWTFKRALMGYPAPESDQVVALPVPGASAAISPFRDYELVLPYGDTALLLGVHLSPEALWEMPAPRPSRRWLAFGDSVTQGLGASDIGHSYTYLLADSKRWQLVNAGFGGRGAAQTDGTYLGEIDADLVSIAMGVNNWQGGTDPEVFRGQIKGLISRLREAKPTIPVYIMTPLWVSPIWQPPKAKYPLETYRTIIGEAVAAMADPHLHLIDGAALIDHDPSLFDRAGVHPNDQGHAQMAERLALQLPD